MTSSSMSLEEAVARIRQPDADAMSRAAERQATLTKPPGSLGQLEELSIRLAGIMRTERPRIGDAIIPATIAGAGSMSSTWRATQYRGASCSLRTEEGRRSNHPMTYALTPTAPSTPGAFIHD